MKELPELLTERLRLRAFTPADAPDVQRLCSAAEIADTTLHIPHPYPDGAAEAWIAGQAEGVRSDREYIFAITRREDGALIGAIELGVRRHHSRAEMGYWIGVPYWGRGYATEAARNVIAFGFTTLDLNRIYAGYFARNPASRRVQEKAGMRYEGMFVQDVLKEGRYEDVGQCGLTRDVWRLPPAASPRWEEPAPHNDFLAPHIAHLARCYHALTGRELADRALPLVEQARQIWESPFAVVSHNTAPEPIFNYGNRTALRLFAMTWKELTSLPSRQSAEPLHQPERARLFETVRAQGYIDDYRGVRIAKTGRRFWIENATVWTLTDEAGLLYGQAAMFARWRDLQ